MTTAYTSLLGLALPVTGELSGTWGDTVNTAITSLLDTAVAGTTSITTDADITLTTTTGASNQARQAIILWNPASGTTTRYITAPAQSKMYVVINASGGTQSIVIRGAGPTTGVTVVKGESATVAWNGSDFVKVSSSGGGLTLTDLTVTGNTTLGDAAADTLTVNATSTFNSPVNFTAQVKLPSTGRSAAAALTPTNPAFLYGVASTYTDTTSSGTLAPVASFYGFAQPTLSTSNVTTYTNAATLYIANAPAAGGSATITNPYALYIAAGNTYFGGNVASNLLFVDNTYDIGASGATRPRDLFLSRNITVGGNTTLGDATSDTLTVNALVNSNLLFTDNTYDIGASGATRPRNLYLAGVADVKGGVYYQASNSTNAWYVYTYTDNTWRVNYNGAGGDELTLTSSGDFGVGTTTPGYKLDVAGSLRAVGDVLAYGTTNSPQLVSLNNGNRLALAIDSSTGSAFGSAYSANLWVQGAYPLRFWTSDALRATLSTGGDFGLGTTSPNVQGIGRAFTVSATEAGYEVVNGSTLFTSLNGNANGGVLTGVGAIGLRFYTSASGSASERLRIDTSGQIAFGSSTVYNGGGFGRVLSIYDSSAACTTYVNASRQYQLGINSSSYFGLYDATSAVYRWLVDTNGGVGIGTSSAAAAKLEVIASNGTTFFKVGNDAGNYLNYGQDGSGYYIEQNGGSGATQALRVQNSNGSNLYASIRFDGGNSTIAFGTSSTERGRFTSTGLFGIGTSAPNGLLDVKGGSIWVSNSTNDTALIMSTTASAVTIQASYNTTGAYVPITFRTSEQERMRVDTSGPVMINRTTYPSGIGSACRLMVQGNEGEWSTSIENPGTISPYGLIIKYSALSPNGANSPFVYAADTTTARFYVYSNGGVVNYQANNVNLSDRREKTNFAPAGEYLPKICAIPVQTFNYIDQDMQNDPDLTLGVVAQDVEAVAPELVRETDWSTERDGSKMRLSIYQTDLQYALMKCIQELKAELDLVKAELTTLKGI